MDDARMHDEWAIGRVLARYCRYLDDQRYDDVVSLFAPGGVLDSMGKRAEGRDAIRAFFPDPGQVSDRPTTMHALSNIVVEIEGDTARAESDWAMIQRDEHGATGIVLAGRYRDELQRLQGEWYLSSRTPVALARPATTDRSSS